MPYSNPITKAELTDLAANNPLHPRDGSPNEMYMPPAYFLVPPATTNGPVKWRLFDAAYIQTGIIDPNRLGAGATGAGNLYLADDGTWKAVSGGGGAVDRIIAGTNISISPTGGTGNVTINATTLNPDPTGYGSFFSNQTQAISVIDTPQVVTFNNTYEANDVYLSSNRIYFNKAGTYQFAYIAQVFNTSNDIEHCSFWIRYNGNNFPNSATHITVNARKSSTEPSEQQMKLILSGTAQNDGDYIELYWQGTSTNLSLGYVAAGPGEAPVNSPSVIANIIPIGAQGRDSNLNELNDVTITSPVNNQLLRYNSGIWENWTPNFLTTVPTLAQVTTAGNTTTNEIIVGGLRVNNNATNPQIGVESNRPTGAPNFVGINFRNTNTTSNKVQFTIGGGTIASGEARTFSFGVDVNGAGTKDFFIYNGNTTNTPLIITPSDNVKIGNSGISYTDAGYKLDVNGSTRIKGAGSTSASNALVIQNSLGIQALAIKDNGITSIASINSQTTEVGNAVFNADLDPITITGGRGNSDTGVLNISTTIASFAPNFGGTKNMVRIGGNFTVGSSATGTVNFLAITPTINYPIGSSGTQRGIYIAPTLTRVTNYKAIEVAQGIIVTTSPITASSALAQGVYFNNTLVAAANNDVLVGLDINPTFTNGAFTGVQNWGLRVQSSNILLSTTKGIYFGNSGYGITGEVGTGSLSFYTNSTERLKIDNAGAITAGGSARFANVLLTGSNIQLLNGLWYFNIENDGNGLQVKNVSGSNTVPFRIFKNDNVAIGTTTDAGHKLQVLGNVRFSSAVDTYHYITSTATGSAGTIYTNTYHSFFTGTNYATANSWEVYDLTSSASRIHISGVTGNVAINQTYAIYKLDVAGDIRSTTGAYFATTSGSVGIGTTTPASKLDVVGDVNVSGVFAVGGVGGWTGTITIMTNPPGQQNIHVTGGIITGFD